MPRANPAAGPGIASVRPTTSARARAEELSSLVLERVLLAHHESNDLSASNVRLGERVGLCERMLRDYRDGSRAVPFWFVLALPHDLALEVLRAAVDELARDGHALEHDAHHRRAGAAYGELCHVLDDALSDGQLSVEERRGLASLWRRIEARAAQAAVDVLRTDSRTGT